MTSLKGGVRQLEKLRSNVRTGTQRAVAQGEPQYGEK